MKYLARKAARGKPRALCKADLRIFQTQFRSFSVMASQNRQSEGHRAAAVCRFYLGGLAGPLFRTL